MSDRNTTNFLRVLAIGLVVNSHMDSIYPPQLSFLATGGMIGNALFFMLSACGLLLSMQSTPRTFPDWYARRIIRIYPSVWVVVVIINFPLGIYSGAFKLGSLLDEMGKFFYPPFWFLQAILLFYVIVYFIIRDFSCRRLALVSVPVIFVYALSYIMMLDLQEWSIEQTPFRLIYYLLVVLWGIYLGSESERLHFRGARDICFLILSVAVIYGHKYLMHRGVLLSLQFVQHLISFPMLYFLMKVAKSNFIRHTLMEHRYAGKVLTFVSGMTLEIFMVNNSIDSLASKVWPFPLNLIALVSINIALALLIVICARPLRKMLEPTVVPAMT